METVDLLGSFLLGMRWMSGVMAVFLLCCGA
jgi:hypothetical protein